jgi:tRNA(Leu) C34 or U34 (ribose-2'-O)-methylase TrmL
LKTTHVSIGLINPKSPTNVGAVMRAAGCFGADSVFYTGNRYDRAMSFSTDTKNRTQSIPLNGVDDLLENKTMDAKVVCVELVENATALHLFEHPDRAYYIFGPEDGTINQDIIDQADAVVYIPSMGCLNLAATVNVVLYDRLVKSKDLIADNELISKSKDVNNTIKIKNF